MNPRPTYATELGASIELDVASKLIRLGCEVFRSLTSSSEVDLVVLRLDGIPLRLQVRQATADSKGNGKSAPSVDLVPHRYPYSGKRGAYTKIDFFVAKDGFDFYIIPAEECSGMRRFGLHSRPQYRNAWHLIVGDPVEQLIEEDAIPQLEMLTFRGR